MFFFNSFSGFYVSILYTVPDKRVDELPSLFLAPIYKKEKKKSMESETCRVWLYSRVLCILRSSDEENPENQFS